MQLIALVVFTRALQDRCLVVDFHGSETQYTYTRSNSLYSYTYKAGRQQTVEQKMP